MQARPFFFGGLISAVLLRLALEPYDHDFVAWFALVPLLYSLYRHRTDPWMRLFHGLGFGLVLVPWSQIWFFTAELAAADPAPTLAESLTVSLKSGVACVCIAVFSGLFALASGPLLRGSRARLLIGLPLLWVSLEVVRGAWPLSELQWLTGWLTLGYALDASDPAAQIVRCLGVYGLSGALVLASTCFVVALVDRRWKMQLAAATVGAILPIALSFDLSASSDVPAHAIGERGADERWTRLAILVAADTPPDELQELAASLADMKPTIVLCPVKELLPAITPTLAGDDGATASGEPGVLRYENRLLGVYSIKPERPSPAQLGDTQLNFLQPGLAQSAAGALSINGGHDWLTPAPARAACQAGAELLTFLHDDDAREGQRQISNMQRYRARESGRWVIAISGSTALIADSRGETVLELPPGLASAAVEQVVFDDDLTFYTRYGGALELGCLVITLAMILWSSVGPARSRRKKT